MLHDPIWITLERWLEHVLGRLWLARSARDESKWYTAYNEEWNREYPWSKAKYSWWIFPLRYRTNCASTAKVESKGYFYTAAIRSHLKTFEEHLYKNSAIGVLMEISDRSPEFVAPKMAWCRLAFLFLGRHFVWLAFLKLFCTRWWLRTCGKQNVNNMVVVYELLSWR